MTTTEVSREGKARKGLAAVPTSGEFWSRRDIPDYDGWQADYDGRVFRDGVEKGRTYRGQKRRVYVYANGRNTARARLVCMAFHGPQPTGLPYRCVAHRNDVKDDDRPENLYWATGLENHADAVRNGLIVRPPMCRPGATQRRLLAILDDEPQGISLVALRERVGFVRLRQIRKAVDGLRIRGLVWTRMRDGKEIVYSAEERAAATGFDR